MVAYSFNKQFVPLIQSGHKRQTIRANRKRHARVGETVQLYTGMRTRDCQKIIADQRCNRVDEVRFDLSAMANLKAAPGSYAEMREMIDSRAFEIAVNGMPISRQSFDFFAHDDGFRTMLYDRKGDQPLSPFDMMLLYWMSYHGAAVFNGAMISWEPA
jgi:hypothetical protein